MRPLLATSRARSSKSSASSRTSISSSGAVVIPVTDAAGTEFDWGVWVSLSRDSFTRALSLWSAPGREREQPYFGWMSTELPLYRPSTLSLKTRVHTQAVGQRPLIELEPTDHPLAVEQRTGITLARVQEIAEMLLHALPAPLHARDPHLPRLSSVHADSGALRLGAVDRDLTHRHMVNRAITRPFPPFCAVEATLIAGGGAVQNRLIWR